MSQSNICSDKFEQILLSKGIKLIAGIDEVGRGALAGPVVASAVIFDLSNFPAGLNDWPSVFCFVNDEHRNPNVALTLPPFNQT